MNKAVISLGSNVDNREELLKQALDMLGEIVSAHTAPYDDPVDTSMPHPYLNVVALLATHLDYDHLRKNCKEIERRLGRRPSDKEAGLIPMDIDIVVFNGELKRPADFVKPYFKKGFSLLHDKL